jgi:PAS domain S-box-containing protein
LELNTMTTELRKTGISVVGDVPWGTHFCHFYETKEDLLDILIPYFTTGLESSEFCMWVVADPLAEEEAREALRLAVPEAEQHLEAGRIEIVPQALFLSPSRPETSPADQIEIVPHTDWYLKGGAFIAERVIEGWNKKLAEALAKGFTGLRANGNEAWLTEENRKDFLQYEKTLDKELADQRIILLCSYPLADTGAAEIFDVVRTHQFALVRRRGNWEVVESPELKQAKAEIQRLNEKLEQRVVERTRQLAKAVEELTYEVAERKRAEDALRRSEDHLRLVLDTTPALIHTGRPDGYLDYFNQRWLKYVGRSLEELKGWGWTASIHPDDVEGIVNEWRASLASGEPFQYEARVRQADGEYRWLLHRKVPLRDERGNIVKWYGSSIDIEGRKRAELETRRLIDAIPHQIWSGPPDGTLDFANERWRADTGLSLEELRGNGWQEMLHPDDRDRVIKAWQASVQNGTPYQQEERHRRFDGTYRLFLSRGVPLRDPEGRIVRWYGTNTDIEDRKRAEDSLQEALDEISKLKDQLYKENIVLREEIISASMFEEIVGTSSALQEVLALVTKVAPTDSTVLITGETGTGKELIARAIHNRSGRSARVFVTVHCAAIPPSLVASELFGHEKGAFTGAVQQRLGRFELAEGGTIFLDEIGELPADTQIALLRVLQEHEFERVGGTKSIRVDVRVIAATNRNLQAAIDAGTFRSDLFYRLNVFPIEMPPLRERREDIPLLVEYFIHRYASKMGKKIRRIDKTTLTALASSAWPGNIRELQNVIERSVILNETETFRIDKNWLTRHAQQTPREKVLSDNLASHEKDMIEAALAESRGQVSGPAGAAAKLGLPPSTLDSRIKALKINKHRFKAG